MIRTYKGILILDKPVSKLKRNDNKLTPDEIIKSKMIKLKKKRNPLINLNELFDDVTLIQERYGDKIYKLTLNKDKLIGKLNLKKGTYIYKEFEYDLRKGVKEYIYFLSDNELIPKIFYIGDNYFIQEYFKSVPLKYLIKSLSKNEKILIYNKIEKLLSIWHDFKIGHGDLHTGNIIIDTFNNVYLIDPYLVDYDGNYNNNTHYNIMEDKKYIRKVRKELLGK